jgi:hypothetical protein
MVLVLPSSKAPPPPPPPKPLPPKPPMIVPPRSKAPPFKAAPDKAPMIVPPRSKAPPHKAPMIVPPRSKAPPHKAAPEKRKHEEVASSSSKVAKVAGSKSPAAAEATRPPLQLQATTSKSASSSSTHDVHMYQQPRTPEVEITDDHSRDSDSLPGTPCTDQGAGKEVEEEIEVLDLYLPQERYMSRLILAKCDVCQDTEEGPKVCVSAYTQRDCDIACKDLPKVFCKECYNAGQSL